MHLSVAFLEILIENHEAQAQTHRTRAKAWSALLELKYSSEEAVFTEAVRTLQARWEEVGVEPTYDDVAFAISTARMTLNPKTEPTPPLFRPKDD